MKNLWCWRCKMEIPMLDEEEYSIATQLYHDTFNAKVKTKRWGRTRLRTRKERFKPLLDYYEEVTGFHETEPNAIMHHRISIYGPPCEKCSKPYRTPEAKLCAACGNKRA